METHHSSAAPYLELAHVVPGRIRLRWRNGNAPPAPEFLARLRGEAGVAAVTYRPASRSVVIEHRNGFDLHRLCALSGEAAIDVREPPPPPPLEPPRLEHPAISGKHADYVATVEGLVLLGLMYTWVRDMVLTRTFRIGTVLLLLLTGLSLYRRWQRRTGEKDAAIEYGGVDELETLEFAEP